MYNVYIFKPAVILFKHQTALDMLKYKFGVLNKQGNFMFPLQFSQSMV